MQLPEVREIDTRLRLFQLYPDARELRPPPNVQIAIEGIVALLRGAKCDFAEVALDMTRISAFNQRVYAWRAIFKRRLLSIEGASPTASKTLFDVLLPVAPPRAHT